MKAIVYTDYGPPEILQEMELTLPPLQRNEVLVTVAAAAANPADWHLMRGAPFLARVGNGFHRPNRIRLGADVAGTVAAVGNGVTEFHIGDEVFGSLPLDALGSFAEQVIVRTEFLALKPASVTFEQAAAVPLAAFTALQGLRDKGKIRQGQRVLINGASGGVGTFAVQIAKSYGSHVTGVCSTRNAELVRSIGADHVIDYTVTDFTRTGEQYDLIFDAVGNRTVADLRRALRPNGIASVAGFTSLPLLFGTVFSGAFVTLTSDKNIGLMKTAFTNKKDLLVLQDLLATGRIVPVIDRTFPLERTADAIRHLETGRARGKVVITVPRNA